MKAGDSYRGRENPASREPGGICAHASRLDGSDRAEQKVSAYPATEANASGIA
jgi:hypothetical protein